MGCKDLEKDIAGDNYTLVNFKVLSIEQFCTWDNSDGIDNNGYAYLGLDKCVNFEKEL